LTELADALFAGMSTSEGRPESGDRLLSIDEAADRLGIGRTALYGEITAGRCRSIKVGRRRLVPASAVSDYAERAA
jgi:excisionase family DNA binding protein